MKLIWTILTLPAVTASAESINVSFDAFNPLFEVRSTYLSFNIDTGSLHNDMDFKNDMLVQLVSKQLLHF
jgi:hypothetical protein